MLITYNIFPLSTIAEFRFTVHSGHKLDLFLNDWDFLSTIQNDAKLMVDVRAQLLHSVQCLHRILHWPFRLDHILRRVHNHLGKKSVTKVVQQIDSTTICRTNLLGFRSSHDLSRHRCGIVRVDIDALRQSAFRIAKQLPGTAAGRRRHAETVSWRNQQLQTVANNFIKTNAIRI